MKKRLLTIFLIFNIGIFAAGTLPKVEKFEGVKPWWLNGHESTEGVLEGIGVVNKRNKENGNLRIEAMELAKREISGIKNTQIDSTLTLEENNIAKSLNISTIGTTKEQVKATLVDTYEDEDNYYAYMVEFFDDLAYEKFINFLNENNRKFLENKNEYIKYLNKIVITNKKMSKITLNAGINKGLEKNEILNVYRLTEANLNPLTKELNDFSKEKVGEIVIEEVFEGQAIASADVYSTFKVKTGDIAVKSGEFKKEKEEIKAEKIGKLQKKYDYNLDYEPQVLNVERAVILGPKQYEFALMSDFSDKIGGQIKTGLLRFIEGSISFDMEKDFDLSALLKVGFPISKTTNLGLSYIKELSDNKSYVMGLLEYSFYENFAMFNLNYTSPIGEAAAHETIGASVQLKPDKNVLIGMEYVNKNDNVSDDYLALKLNLKVIDETWLGGGVIWDDNKTYFLKISRVMIF